MYGYIYKTTNLINGKIYIGKHANQKVKDTQQQDPNYYGSGVILREAINKNGIDNFKCEIIKECNSEDELNKAEIFYINKYKKLYPNLCYNIAEGGKGGNNLKYKSEKEIKEIHEQIRNSINAYYKTEKAKITRNNLLANPEYHKKLSEVIKKSINNPNSKYHSLEYKQLKSKIISELHSDPNSTYNSKEYRYKLKIANSKKYDDMTEEQLESFKLKHRKIALKNWKDSDYRKKMINANTNRKRVIVYYNDKILLEFNSVNEANSYLHIDVRYTIKNKQGIIQTGKYKGMNVKAIK